METLVIGVISNYGIEQVRNWVNSLRDTGYDGHVCLIDVCKPDSVNKELSDFLQKNNVTHAVYYTKNSDNLMVDRFYYVWHTIETFEQYRAIEAVTLTDVRDVIFQEDPAVLMKNMGHSLLHVESEGFRYEDEPWSRNNMMQVFGPIIYDKMKRWDIHCAGVILGTRYLVSDLCIQIFLMARGMPKPLGGGGADQSVMNFILSSDAWASCMQDHYGLILHAGTSFPAIRAGSGDIGLAFKTNNSVLEKYKQKITFHDKEEPIMTEEGYVINPSTGEKYHIVHQYDRVPNWRSIIDEKYKN